MATETTTVQGKVVTPDGVAATAGTLTIQLSTAGQITDGTNVNSVGGAISTSISGTGDVSFALVPNDQLNPSGTFYRATYSVTAPVRAKWVEDWTVAVTPDPVDIGDITRVSVYPTIQQQVSTASEFIVSALPTASSSLLGLVYVLDTGTGETSSWMCHRTAADVYDWVYSGGGFSALTTISALPATTNYAVGDRVFLDTGSGETSSYVLHRDATGSKDWTQYSTGGS